jgi:hypothetical protein
MFIHAASVEIFEINFLPATRRQPIPLAIVLGQLDK